MNSDPDRSFLSSSSIARPSNIQHIKDTMSLRATTPYYSSAHTARNVSNSATAIGAGAGANVARAGAEMKEGAKGVLKSPWIVGLLPFVNGGISGMVVSTASPPLIQGPVGLGSPVKGYWGSAEADPTDRVVMQSGYRCGPAYRHGQGQSHPIPVRQPQNLQID